MSVNIKTGKIQGATGEWEMVIGLEVHAQVISKAKLFSGSSTNFGGEPNNHVSLVDAAMPGMLPVINGECVRQAVRTGLALGAKINKYSVFDRKNYFYADLPQGYQISQFKSPVVGHGTITLDMGEGVQRQIGVERIHLEQDAGKSMHDQHPSLTFVDLNRSGVALMEIVLLACRGIKCCLFYFLGFVLKNKLICSNSLFFLFGVPDTSRVDPRRMFIDFYRFSSFSNISI